MKVSRAQRDDGGRGEEGKRTGIDGSTRVSNRLDLLRSDFLVLSLGLKNNEGGERRKSVFVELIRQIVDERNSQLHLAARVERGTGRTGQLSSTIYAQSEKRGSRRR